MIVNSIESYVSQFETNFFGVVKVTQAVLPHFREKKSGSIVFVGSVGGVNGDPGGGAYCGTKHALEGMHSPYLIEYMCERRKANELSPQAGSSVSS